ncbi:hypothetical protein LPJ78_004383 [Coemansia sp. RSA 989]|nr:hypothetical protein LPJ68_003691 [Coemansia sp. RSA 1086]KAJ1748844.1 hypothetical protein LPJ79_004207 [Coemansia sp. RSA 1821]KAJ1862934.1 hypothetical protein LPJ78_004383 [Coemansia sp. RSA 989]KAJ1870780.1 hypothetical protein LPJ55_004402 [Coemansia sp. RSA 990]KAJ2670166.1 hypothetical protein IWW42_004124 [Coemansia sp. RSA 1085]
MFEQYGPIVRVGPNKVGVGEISMFRKMMSSHEMTKSQMYADFSAVGENVFTTRSPEFNKARRRQIGPAFSSAYVRKMEPLIMAEGVERVCRLFDAQISAAKCKAEMQDQPAQTNLYYAFTMMATDVISSLAYGRCFGAVDTLMSKVEPAEIPQNQNSDNHQSPQQIGQFEAQETPQTILGYMLGTMMLMGLMAEAPYIDKVSLRLLPQKIRQLYLLRDKFMRFTCNTVERYRQWMFEKGSRNDILSAYIRAQDPETGATMSTREIASESTVLLAAGTDTTANIMVNCVRLLLRHPDKYAQVKSELRTAFPGGPSSITYAEALCKLPYLSAAIYETMRLRASTSGVWPRDAPRHTGVSIGGYFVPPGTVICGSIGGVHLNPETWPLPKKFAPERFLGEAGELRKRNVVAFSAGIRVCPGRHLAMMELMMTLSTVLLKYDFALAGNDTISDDYFDEVDESCHITTTFSQPDRDCTFIISHAQQ